MTAAAAFLVVLNFVVGHSEPPEYTVRCPDWACVENIMAHTDESRALARLRVFPAGTGFSNVSRQTPWAPLIDWWTE